MIRAIFFVLGISFAMTATGETRYYCDGNRMMSGDFWYHPSGNRAQSNSFVYYENGNRLKGSSFLYYKNGNRLKGHVNLYYANGNRLKGDTRFYYKNGNRLKSGDRCYYENGNRMGECPETFVFQVGPDDGQMELEVDLSTGEIVRMIYWYFHNDRAVTMRLNGEGFITDIQYSCEETSEDVGMVLDMYNALSSDDKAIVREQICGH